MRTDKITFKRMAKNLIISLIVKESQKGKLIRLKCKKDRSTIHEKPYNSKKEEKSRSSQQK